VVAAVGAGLDRLRTVGQDAVTGERWVELVELRPGLEGDVECWWSLWAPVVAVGLYRTGRAGEAVALLTAAVTAGFRQPDLFGPLLSDTFTADPAWPGLTAGMAAPAPPAAVTLLEWPDSPPMLPLVLEGQPDGRAAELAARLPTRKGSAWATAQATLGWVHRAWVHANAHVTRADALTVLDRVDAGERFACVEYSIVLTQALNALAIPARRVSLRADGYHQGLGRGHVVSEAWIDDLGRWVLLDGQNGAWWTDPDGAPLSTCTLHDRHRDQQPVMMVDAAGRLPDGEQAAWAGYFAHTATTGVLASPGPFVPVFQSTGVVATSRLVHDPALVEPDLSGLHSAVTAADRGQPELRLTPVHPYATGVTVVEDGHTRLVDTVPAVLPLTGVPGRHDVTAATTTGYAVLTPHPVTYDRC